MNRLLDQTRDDDAAIRVMACNALGAFRDDEAIAALVERLNDPETRVRYAASFALTLIGTPIAADALKPRLTDEDANLRLLAARGVGRAGELEDAEALLELCANDAEPAVRAAAAVSVGRLMERSKPDRTTAIEKRLAAIFEAEGDDTVRWRAAWALSRGGSSVEDDVIRPLAAAVGPARSDSTPRPERWTRLMALRALGRRGQGLRAGSPDGPLPRSIAGALGDVEPQVVLAALRAADESLDDGAPMPNAVWAELHFDEFRSAHARAPHVIARAVELLDAHPPAEALTAVLTTPPSGPSGTAAAPVHDDSPTVRAAALVALAHHAPDRAAALCAERATADDVLDRIAAARAARHLSEADGEPLLRRALADVDIRVRTAALVSLAGHRDAAFVGELIAIAAAERDLAMREELGGLLLAIAPGRGAIAREAFEDSPGDAFAEARKLLLDAAVAADPNAPDLDDWLRARLADPSLAVRRAAARQLESRGAETPAFDDHDAGPFPRVGDEVPFEFVATQPRIEIETNKGTIDVILVPSAAPVHVWSFLQLAAAGHYDGTVFHRVVPDFVVQGGSARGDGYDNASWLGGRLRDEVSPMPFLAGVMGMPKTADPDTGGGQLFITLVPAPHLDARYTALGRVNIGLAVAESIEVGDRIVRIVAKTD